MNRLLLLIIDQKERIRRQDSPGRRVCSLQPVNLEAHKKSHDLFKSQNTLSTEVNKYVCEPFGCFKEATTGSTVSTI